MASSTVITPSSPTRWLALATTLPMLSSLWAETVATWARSFSLGTGRDCVRRASTASTAPCSKPRLSSTALHPATTLRSPSDHSAWARIVEVEVPSPTCSPVRTAACSSTFAPRFSSGSANWNSLAIATPSLQISGLPQLLSIRTLRDLGPSVTRTALASAVVPRSSFSRASV